MRTIEDVEILDAPPIGEGAFSRVYDCRLKADGRLYALKIVA